MGKLQQDYIDYLEKHPEIDPEDQHKPREAHTMRNRYTKRLDRTKDERTAAEWREDLTLIAIITVLSFIAVFQATEA